MVTASWFRKEQVADADLELLKWFPQLRLLTLIDTQVTDAGLIHSGKV